MEHITNIGKAEIPKLSVCGIEETINVEVSVMTFQIGASYFLRSLLNSDLKVRVNRLNSGVVSIADSNPRLSKVSVLFILLY